MHIYVFMHFLCIVHYAQKKGGVLYKFVYFDEFIFWGGYYINTKIQTICEIGYNRLYTKPIIQS